MGSCFDVNLFDDFFYHILDVRFTPTDDIFLNYWPGSVIRNRLLYFSEKIEIEENVSLLSLINKIPIDESHFLYRELSGGFPKGYTLNSVCFNEKLNRPINLHKDQIYNFSICLIGKMANYHTCFVEAIKHMCINGIGSKDTPLKLIDISEVHPFRLSRLLYVNGNDVINDLNLPVTVSDFIQTSLSDKVAMDIHFKTPVNLVQNRKKKNYHLSYQDKQNGFPCFYQFTRSVVCRLINLMALYGDLSNDFFTDENQLKLDEQIMKATYPVLNSANLRRVTLKSTPKKQQENQIRFWGYTGYMNYYGPREDYIPLLLFAQKLGVGNDVTYGLGEYRIRIQSI